MNRQILPIAALSIALAACGSDASETGESGEEGLSLEEVADRVVDNAIRPESGQYRATVKAVTVDIPGAPPEAVEMMRGVMGGRVHEYCLTPEDVENGFEEMARRSQDGDCTFDRFNVDSGKIDASMTCSNRGQEPVTITLAGTGTPTRSEMEMTMEGNLGGMGDATIKMQTAHERIGDCA